MASQESDPKYYANERSELARLIPQSAMTILDVGCGNGRLGAALKQNHQRQVFGIEYLEAVAQEARKVLDGVLVGDVQTMPISLPGEFFDCIIFADVLEHLLYPVEVLRRLKVHLKKDGVIVCSIPNIRHYTAIIKIIKGWKYDEYGLFDKTHLRFYTLKTMTQLIHDAGFAIEITEPKIVASRKMLILNFLLCGLLKDRLAMQYLLRAKAAR